MCDRPMVHRVCHCGAGHRRVLFCGGKFPGAIVEIIKVLDLIDNMLVYDPYKRTKPLYLLNHPFLDELRNKETVLENGNALPNLFNWK